MTRTHVLHPDIKSPRRDDARPAARSLEEAVGLAAAIDLEVAGSDVVPLPKAHPGHLFGSGKVEELGERFKEGEIELVVIDGPVTPVQQRNLEKAWKVKILDRTGLILEIFGERARTREGVLQVELAHLNYAKTRLVRSWTHLERQRGGLGFVGGPGETQIEADRRALSDRIKKIERRLETVVKTRELHRGARRKIPYPIVALVGYTNAGKSTLFNRLTEAQVMAEDMLFATLDPTMREVRLPSGRRVILSDTVGFISDLPTQLVAAFRATLEEVLEADLILHVRDMSHPDADAQDADVANVLEALGVGDERRGAMLEVRNKLDLLHDDARLALLNQTGRSSQTVGVSALTGEGVPALLDAVDARLGAHEVARVLLVPSEDGAALAWLHAHMTVDRQESTEAGMRVALRGDPEHFGKFFKRFPDVAETATEL
ncbi:MAG: GTPase HflX [Rhodobacteraceae bacterium]|nr:GTPase HflX [Paracoccaceae bacterium]MBR28843.1 GTPase HflX [Paracoccaceae bacterium]